MSDNSATLHNDQNIFCIDNNSEKSTNFILSDAMIAALLSENGNSEKNCVDEENSVESVDNNATKTNGIVDVHENQKVTQTVNNVKDCEVLVSGGDPSEIPITETALYEISNYRCDDSTSWTEDESSSSSSESDSSDCSDTFLNEIREYRFPKKIPNIKTKGELDLNDLPPIEDLCISVKESELEKIGLVHAVVDKLVVVQSVKDRKALDLDSVLFLSPVKPLGRIFDVFGPVIQPFYSIRFNSAEQITEKGIFIGADVHFAPDVNDVTSYIFVDELRKQKGSDASWKDNNEPPEEFLDFSDDEQERAARRRRQAKNRNHIDDENAVVCAQVPVSSSVALPASFSNERPAYNSSRGINRDASRLIGSALNFSHCSSMSVPHAPPPPCYSPLSIPHVPNPFQIASSSQQPVIFFQPQQPVLPVQQRNVSSHLVGSQSPFPNCQPPVFGPIMAFGSPGLYTPPYPPPVISPAPSLSPIATLLPPQMNFIRPAVFNPTNIGNPSANTPTNFVNPSVSTPPSFVNSSVASHASFLRPAVTPNFLRPTVTPPSNFMQPTNFSRPPVTNAANFSRPPVTNTANFSRPPVSNTANFSRPPMTNTANFSRPPMTNTANYSGPPLSNTTNFVRSSVSGSNYIRPPIAPVGQPFISLTSFERPPEANQRNFGNQFVSVQTSNSALSHGQLTPNTSNICAQNQNFSSNFF